MVGKDDFRQLLVVQAADTADLAKESIARHGTQGQELLHTSGCVNDCPGAQRLESKRLCDRSEDVIREGKMHAFIWADEE